MDHRIFCVVAVAGCAAPADVGQPCVLVRGGADGGAVRILQTDPEIAYSANQDVISFGVSECSTRICVRDHGFVETRTDGFAGGYCSAACGPCPSGMECRALVLDTDTLERLRKSDPERYKRTFGETTTPYFCARP